MWRVDRRRPGVVVLGARGVERAWSAGGDQGAFEHCSSLLPGDLDDAGALVSVLGATRDPDADSGTRRRHSIDVLVSDRWLRWVTVPWTNDLLDKAASNAHYRAQFAAMWGEQADDMEFIADDTPYGQPRVAAGLSRKVREGLVAWAKERGATLGSMRSVSIAAWQSVRAEILDPAYALCVVENGLLSLIAIQNGRPQCVLIHRYQDQWGPELERIWRRVKLREASFAAIGKLYAMTLTGQRPEELDRRSFRLVGLPADVSAAGMPPLVRVASADRSDSALDFVRAPMPTQGWRLALLASGLLLALVTGWQFEQSWQRADAVESQILQLTAPVMSGSAPHARTSGEEQATVRVVNQAIRQLNVPIRLLLQAVQPPRELRTALLGLDVADGQSDSGNPKLRITAEARTGQDMAGYVAHLSRTRPFTSAYLTRHEIVETSPERPYRFTVEGTWQE